MKKWIVILPIGLIDIMNVPLMIQLIDPYNIIFENFLKNNSEVKLLQI